MAAIPKTERNKKQMNRDKANKRQENSPDKMSFQSPKASQPPSLVTIGVKLTIS